MNYGQIETEVSGWKLGIEFSRKKMTINISNGAESMTSNVSYDFEPIDTKAPFEDGIRLNWILERVDLEKINLICEEYDKLTDDVMTKIYNNCKSE